MKMKTESKPEKRPEMAKQSPSERRSNFEEVALGYNRHEAVAEAKRCLDCKKPPCIKGCPVGVDIPCFIRQIAEEDFDSAALTLKSTNSLPAICGRVCPQETQCEAICVLGKSGKVDPIAIGGLERFVADCEGSYCSGSPGAHRQTRCGRRSRSCGTDRGSRACEDGTCCHGLRAAARCRRRPRVRNS